MAREIYTVIYHHKYDNWTKRCQCGEGPFTRDEWRAHYVALPKDEQHTILPGVDGVELLKKSLGGPR